MDFNKLYDQLPMPGWLGRDEGALLYKAAATCKGPILEVGSYHGRSTVLLAQLGRPVFAVEPFDDFHDDPRAAETEAGFMKNTAPYPNITLFREKIEDWEAQPVGFAYLDGTPFGDPHSYEGTRVQILKALECKPTVIAVHDYADRSGGLEVKRACLELMRPPIARASKLAIFRLGR